MHSIPFLNTPKKKVALITTLLVILLVVLGSLIGWGAYRYFHPLVLKEKTYIIQPNSEFDPYENIKTLAFGSIDDVTFNGNVDTSTLGVSQGQYEYKGKTYPFMIKVEDTLGPDLEVRNVTVDVNAPVTAQDFVVSIFDASRYAFRMDGASAPGEKGTTTVTITAKDEYDNITTKTATLTREVDEVAPSIENFEESISILQGDTYVPQTYQGSDNFDANPTITADGGAVDSNVPGTYTVSYTVTDKAGNQTTYNQAVTVVENPDFGKQICYLTFDDGPSSTTVQILDILNQYGATATFFVIGANPEYYHLMKNIVDSGHTIALHTFSHDYATVYSSEEAYFQDLQQISDLVENQTGVKSYVIRFPGGSSNTISADYTPNLMTELVQEVENRGYAYFDWNADSTDASGNGVDPSILVSNATAGIGQDNVVLLMHDTDAKSTTAQALPQIIQAYREAGYVFRGLTTSSPAVHHGVNN